MNKYQRYEQTKTEFCLLSGAKNLITNKNEANEHLFVRNADSKCLLSGVCCDLLHSFGLKFTIGVFAIRVLPVQVK